MKYAPTLFLLIFFGMACKKPSSPPSPPSIVVLETPAQNQVCTSGTIISDSISQIQFTWLPSANTDRYVFTIKNLVSGIQSTKTITTNSINLNLNRNTPYSWSVSSQNNQTSLTVQSSIWEFYVAGLPNISYPPFPATLTSPGFGLTLSAPNGTINLTWTGSIPSPGSIVNYDVYFGTGIDDPVYKTQVTNSFLNGIPVVSGKTYYWKILSRDKAGNTSISPLSLFTVQ